MPGGSGDSLEMTLSVPISMRSALL
ncbi:hypothetical protein IEO21_07489 [Rhodonia placenta]|uniref:Uncharacterized protein n=1 Tax=Rhodonia placenta TaxID=104341 RepID=A0A8H7U0A1_9APHY|nr:hypothetical protein IEO21_07489 [Postia placenta]